MSPNVYLVLRERFLAENQINFVEDLSCRLVKVMDRSRSPSDGSSGVNVIHTYIYKTPSAKPGERTLQGRTPTRGPPAGLSKHTALHSIIIRQQNCMTALADGDIHSMITEVQILRSERPKNDPLEARPNWQCGVCRAWIVVGIG
jgi:hypothetical protein